MSDPAPHFQAARLVLRLRQAGVTDHAVTEAMERTPRDHFAPRPFEADAWENIELPIDCGQSMTRPVTVGTMLQALAVEKQHSVLEVGCGTGYVSAVLSHIGGRICSLERYRTLADRARSQLEREGLAGQVEVRHADGFLGWPDATTFDRILVMGAVAELPPDLAKQVAPGGVVVMPQIRNGQTLIVGLRRRGDGAFAEREIAVAGFAPLEHGIAKEL
jgi:protein-L-isoaspartate(D-aspartate) O-methyltransferase